MSFSVKKKYPQAAPFRAPEDLAAKVDQWRRRAYWLVAAVVAMALVGIGSATLAFNHVRAAKNPSPSVSSELDSIPEVLAKPAMEIAAPKPKAAPVVSIVPPTLPRKPVDPPSNAVAKPDNRRERYLETLGSLCAAHLFQSYLNIGLLADGVESEAYTAKEAEESLRSINEMMNHVEANLTTLAKSNLEAEDVAAIEQIKTVTAMLRLQSKCLEEYWRTGQTPKAEEYHEARNAAWKGLTKVLQ